MVKRIDLSDKSFLNVAPCKSSAQYCMIERWKESNKKPELLGGIKLKPGDMARTFATVMLANGISAAEIVAELFAQIHDIDAEILESLMRR